ncbi:major facilitator superfamily domain-containing protein [Elsinoe ampelina]|uniref:Major facilitator superfamily domain-containing protein n=1 Tax=Elsinoe ampelina TaxID=302913 RepID=A0A6A6GPL1_9PEZI|nr:major facilitator superfamily domain-containing protein [Elsinoe ampelina]
MATVDEKIQDERVEYIKGESDSETDYDARINAFSPEQQKKIIRRIDIRLVSTLGFMYCVSLMDRTNLGIAAVAGMSYDLALTVGARYSIITLVFFFTYVFLQPPATVILRKVGPKWFLPVTCLAWGILTIGFGFVHVWWEMIPLRLVLGVLEAGFFPGCAYLLSCWYPRYELQKRNAVFFLIGSMSSAFSGILSYGFMQLNGQGSGNNLGQSFGPTAARPTAPRGRQGGIAGWRWIFILQGVLTCAAALVGFVTIVDFPEHAAKRSGISLKFLNEQEADFVVARIEKDRNDAIASKFNLREYLRCGADLKIWGFAALFGLTTTTTYAIAFFLPIILRNGMGFSVAMSQILIAPPYVAAAFVMYGMAWAGDKWHIRSPWVIINGLLALTGLPMLGFSSNVGVRYFGVFLATIAANANIPCILTWQANNIRGQWKRALCSATLVGTGGIGGIIGSTVFRSQDAPGYRPGIIATMLASGLIVLISLLLNLKFWRANKRAEAGGKIIEGLEGFRYTL